MLGHVGRHDNGPFACGVPTMCAACRNGSMGTAEPEGQRLLVRCGSNKAGVALRQLHARVGQSSLGAPISHCVRPPVL